MSHIDNAISELEQEKDAIDRALSALRAIGTSGPKPDASNNSRGVSGSKRRLSAEGRQNIIAALSKRWAEKRASQDGAAPKKVAPTKKAKKSVLSAQARKKMSEAGKKRWAAQKKEAGKS